jgi:hypothetical protein
LYFADNLFQGSQGAEFRQRVIDAAAEFGINRGLLATITASEPRTQQIVDTFTGTGPVLNTVIGLDYWGSTLANEVRLALGLTRAEFQADLPSTPVTVGGATLYRNEAGTVTGPYLVFPNGATALRAIAARIRAAEIYLTRRVGVENWNNLPVGTRFELLRLYYNAGHGPAFSEARRAVNGADIRVKTGPVIETAISPTCKAGPHTPPCTHPRRAATIRAAQAVHTSGVLGEPVE